ncbi:MAG: M23 family metallopeptidase [Pseudomonadota bacterium]|nr:M23 family metallopeptidase [Pseudomonadota bacterium]
MNGKLILGIALATWCVFESAALWAQAGTLPVSKGRYRLPYANGTEVRASNDHTNHPSLLNQIDMSGTGGAPYTIVAAADGWLRIIEDDNTLWCPGATGGNPTPCGVLPLNVCCERSNVACNSGCRNNFVWIEHTNGEWSKYSHMVTGSVAANGHQLNDFVQSGAALGTEGRVGFASGPHLHFNIARLNAGIDSINSAGFLVDDGDPTTSDYNRQHRIPAFCTGAPIWLGGDTGTAAACGNFCLPSLDPNDTVSAGEVFHRQAGTITPGAAHRVLNGGGEALFAQTRITLGPGFSAAEQSYFSAATGPCNSPGGD